MRGRGAVVAVRVCRCCGKPVAMDLRQDDETRPWACRGCLADLLAGPAPPWWAEGADARLAAAAL